MATSIHGTPVVPGLAFGPVLVATSEVAASAVASYGDGGHADAAAALEAYDDAVALVADGFRAKAAATTGATAEVLAPPELRRQLRGTVSELAAIYGGKKES